MAKKNKKRNNKENATKKNNNESYVTPNNKQKIKDTNEKKNNENLEESQKKVDEKISNIDEQPKTEEKTEAETNESSFEDAFDSHENEKKLLDENIHEIIKCALLLSDERKNFVDLVLPSGRPGGTVYTCDIDKPKRIINEKNERKEEERSDHLEKVILLDEANFSESAGSDGPLLSIEEILFHPRMPPTVGRDTYSCIIRTSNGRVIRPKITSCLYYFNGFISANKDRANLIELIFRETLVPSKGSLRIRLTDYGRGHNELLVVPYNFEDMPADSITHIRQRSFCIPPEAVSEVLLLQNCDYDAAMSYMKYSLYAPFFCKLKGKVFLGRKIKIIEFPILRPARTVYYQVSLPVPLYATKRGFL